MAITHAGNMTPSYILVAFLALLGGAINFARAESITYVESAIATGSLNGTDFTDALLTLTATGDTSNVTGTALFRLAVPDIFINIAGLVLLGHKNNNLL